MVTRVCLLLQALLDGVTAAFYNAFFTAGPICAFALFDRPVRNLDTLMQFPQHYNRRPALTTRVFWKTGILWAVAHAVVRTHSSFRDAGSNCLRWVSSALMLTKGNSVVCHYGLYV